MAHEVNNPLAFVRANLNALRDCSSIVGGPWLAAKSTVRLNIALALTMTTAPTSLHCLLGNSYV